VFGTDPARGVASGNEIELASRRHATVDPGVPLCAVPATVLKVPFGVVSLKTT